MRHISLRTRLTLLIVSLVIVLAVILTFSSVYNAGNLFADSGLNHATVDGGTAYADEATDVFRNVSVLLMFATIVIGGISAYFMVSAALRPMRELNYQIKNINAHSLNSRITEFEADDEINQLATSFNEMLERLDDAFNVQKRFSSAAAHELKTPLAAIKTNLDVLAIDKTADIEEYEEVYVVIRKQTERMIKLVNSLLATSRSESYSIDELIDLGKMVQDILTEQQASIEEKQLSVHFDNQELIKVHANSTMLHRSLTNLIENAVKYNVNHGKLELSLYRDEHMANLRITNTGIDIAPEHLPHIFEPFYRVDDSRSRKIAGAGLGLSIAKDTIERHNGKIVIESKPNLVNCFVRLPIINTEPLDFE